MSGNPRLYQFQRASQPFGGALNSALALPSVLRRCSTVWQVQPRTRLGMRLLMPTQMSS